MQKAPSEQSLKESAPTEQPPPTSSWSQEERMAIVTKLHDLEVVNKRLAEEKSLLQRQLNHVLRRLAQGRVSRQSGDLEEISRLIFQSLQPRPLSSAAAVPGAAPMASTESVSMMETNGGVSISQYSSLSDAFEQIVLEQDPVRRVSLELSSPEEEEEGVELPGKVDTLTTTSTLAVESHRSPASSEISTEHIDWEVHMPSASPALSYRTESLEFGEDIREPRTPPLPQRMQQSSSLPSSPYRFVSRKAVVRAIEEARRSASKFLEAMTPEPSKARREGIERVESIPERAKRKPYIPHPLREALRRRSHKPRVKVGRSEDFLNEFFPSNATARPAMPGEEYMSAVVFSRSAEIARELGRLFTYLHAFTATRRRCFIIQSIPAQEVQKNINFFLQARRNTFERLYKEDTSSEDTRSITGAQLTTPTIEIYDSQAKSSSFHPVPSTSQYRSQSDFTDYNVPPTDDESNMPEQETLESSMKKIHYEGRLSKLSSRFKLWQNFWCRLADRSLLFFTDESEVDKWPKKCIELSSVQRVERRQDHGVDGRGKMVISYGFNLILQSGKIYTLRAGQAKENRMWETQIRRALRRVQAEKIVQTYGAQLVTSGWFRRYRRGVSQRVWGMLIGTFLVYARDASGQQLTGYRDLTTTYIRCPVVMEEYRTDTDTDIPSSHFAYDEHDGPDSESDTGMDITSSSNLTIALWTPNRDPVYLVCPSAEEHERWRYHLSRACWFPPSTLGVESTSAGERMDSHFLHLWGQLVRPSYFHSRSHSDVPLKEPISKALDQILEKDALDLSQKLVDLSNLHKKYEGGSLEEAEHRTGALYRFPVNGDKCNLIKEIAQMCFESGGLKDELYLQIIKQATPQSFFLEIESRQFGTEPTRRRATRVVGLLCHRDGTESRRAVSSHRHHQPETRRFTSPPGYALKWVPIIVVWECLAIFSTLFLPSPPVLACLQAYLAQFTALMEVGHEEGPTSPHGRQRKAQETRRLYNEISRFAAFCTDMLLKCRIRGGRKIVPSYFEVVAISMRNPYTHSLPFSLPIHIHLPIGYEVVSFDGTMKISQLMGSLVRKLELSEAVIQGLCHCGLYCRISGSRFAFGRAPVKPKLIYLEQNWNICDVISIYESNLSQTDRGSEFNLEDMTIDLVFLITAISKKAILQPSPLTNRIMDIVAHQIHSEVCLGDLNFILRGTHFLELAALMCRCDYLDYAELQRRQEATLTQLVDRIFPQSCLATWVNDDNQALIELKLLLLERWNKVCQETSGPNDDAIPGVLTLPKPAYAYTMYFWRLHPAGACVRHFPCCLVNDPDVPPDETVWLAPSFDKVSILRIYTFDNMLAQPVISTGIEGSVSGMACFKFIPLSRLISFGVQQTGAFFLVYSSVSKSQHSPKKREKRRRHSGQGESTSSTLSMGERRSTSILRNRERTPTIEAEPKFKKVVFLVPDLCEMNELCQVLTFYLENYH